jgi:hypothetical protein
VREPTEKDRNLEQQFLHEHWQYGGRIHEVTADALVAALNEPSEVATGHGLYLRLFSEYAIALENVGAWGWSFRHRHEHPLFLWAFLQYPLSAPTNFYRVVRKSRANHLSSFLQLPRRQRIHRAVAEVLELSFEDYEAMSREAVQALHLCARQYFSEDAVIRQSYNKAKHGATMVTATDLTARQFYVITRNRDAPRLAKFTVDQSSIARVRRGIDIAGSCSRLLAGIAWGLLATGNLYA